jgi:hypothetical protein
MTQTLNALLIKPAQKILCSYRNTTPQLQIARISNIPHWYFERVLFPRELLLFEAVPHAQLEIYNSETITALPVPSIPCQQLQVRQPIY